MSAASYPSSWIAKLRKRDTQLTPLNIRLMHIMTPLDHSKAVRELGWNPSPTRRRSSKPPGSSATESKPTKTSGDAHQRGAADDCGPSRLPTTE